MSNTNVRKAGRPKLFDERMQLRLTEGTAAKIDAKLRDGEDRSGFIREAIEREIKRRK